MFSRMCFFKTRILAFKLYKQDRITCSAYPTLRTTLSVLFLQTGQNSLSYFNKYCKSVLLLQRETTFSVLLIPLQTGQPSPKFSVLPLQTGQYSPSYLYKQDNILRPTFTNRTTFSVLPLQSGQHSPSYLYKLDNLLRPTFKTGKHSPSYLTNRTVFSVLLKVHWGFTV